ncbi:MAG: polysaccharide deacetylase family protein [Treponema sp.]
MYVALSFDDGPNTVTTPQVLDILENEHIPASFFLIGQNITGESVPVIQREQSLGCDIECHSWTHSDMTKMTKEAIQDEIVRTCSLIKKITGTTPSFFRPPYIRVNDTLYEAVHLPFICGMGVDDWVADVSAAERAARVISGVRDGTIVLLHDFSGNVNTVEALKTFIPSLKEKGYTFVTVPQMFSLYGVSPDQPHKIWTYVKQ